MAARLGRAGRVRARKSRTESRSTPATSDATVATAAPRKLRRGKPRLPKIKSQSSTVFRPLRSAPAYIRGRVLPEAWKVAESALESPETRNEKEAIRP